MLPLLVAACAAGPIDDHERLERFDDVKEGMTRGELVDLLGEPDDEKEGVLRWVAYSGPHHGYSLKGWLSGGVVKKVERRHWMEYPERP